MTALQFAALILVALAGAAVVFTPEPLRQALVLAIYGLTLTSFLFFTLQAPDVALSEIVVSTIAMPLIIVAALRKTHAQESRRRDEERDG